MLFGAPFRPKRCYDTRRGSPGVSLEPEIAYAELKIIKISFNLGAEASSRDAIMLAP